MFDYVLVNEEYNLVSNRVQLLETLCGFKNNETVIKNCIIIKKTLGYLYLI